MTIFTVFDFKCRPVAVKLRALVYKISQILDRPDFIKRFCQKEHAPVQNNKLLKFYHIETKYSRNKILIFVSYY